MARLTILTPKELQAIYGLPCFTDEERAAYFTLSSIEKQLMQEYRSFSARIYFVLQLGYFRAKKMFFVFDAKAVADDATYIWHAHFPRLDRLPDLTISKPTRLAQQAAILRLLNYQGCSMEWKRKLQEKAQYLVTIYSKPVYLFRELANFLEQHRVVLPGYSFMQEKVIGKALTSERERLELAVIRGIPETQQKRLDDLLTADDNLYQLTLLKREPKDFSYQEVQKEVDKRAALADLYNLATQFLPSLGVSNENIKYYASLVGYYSVKDLKRMNREVGYAYLLCFILYRYQTVNDNLVQTFIYQVNGFIDDAKKAAQEQMAGEQLDANRHLKDVGKVLALFTDDSIPDAHGLRNEVIAGSEKAQECTSLRRKNANIHRVRRTNDQYCRFSRHNPDLFAICPLDHFPVQSEQDFRLSWKDASGRQCARTLCSRLDITLFGVPSAIARFLGLSTV